LGLPSAVYKKLFYQIFAPHQTMRLFFALPSEAFGEGGQCLTAPNTLPLPSLKLNKFC
jgi:hypothetical protein